MWFCEHHFNTYRQGNTATFTYTSHGIEHAHTCARRDDCPTSQFPKLPKLQLRLAEHPRLPLQDHEKGVLRVTQSSTHWLVNAVSTDAPEAADILRCERSRCHSRVVLLAHLREAIHGGSYAEPQTTRKHGCTMCTMRIHLFDNGMSDVQSLHANHNELLHLLHDVSCKTSQRQAHTRRKHCGAVHHGYQSHQTQVDAAIPSRCTRAKM